MFAPLMLSQMEDDVVEQAQTLALEQCTQNSPQGNVSVRIKMWGYVVGAVTVMIFALVHLKTQVLERQVFEIQGPVCGSIPRHTAHPKQLCLNKFWTLHHT